MISLSCLKIRDNNMTWRDWPRIPPGVHGGSPNITYARQRGIILKSLALQGILLVPRPRLDVEQFAPRIAPQIFVLLIELAQELGVAPQRLCSGLGCSLDELRQGEP